MAFAGGADMPLAEVRADDPTASGMRRALIDQRVARKEGVAAHRKTCFEVQAAVEEQVKNTPSEPVLTPFDTQSLRARSSTPATPINGISAAVLNTPHDTITDGFAALRAQAAVRRKSVAEFSAVTTAAGKAVKDSATRVLSRDELNQVLEQESA